jgi:hypothetical protein
MMKMRMKMTRKRNKGQDCELHPALLHREQASIVGVG